MKVGTKAKWIVGITGTAFSAFVLGQLDDTPVQKNNTNADTIGLITEVNDSMSEREKELVQLDWSNFTLQQNNYYGDDNFDRTTRRT